MIVPVGGARGLDDVGDGTADALDPAVCRSRCRLKLCGLVVGVETFYCLRVCGDVDSNDDGDPSCHGDVAPSPSCHGGGRDAGDVCPGFSPLRCTIETT